jgi:hypothetical protein
MVGLTEIKKLFTTRLTITILLCVLCLLWGLWPGSLDPFIVFLAVLVSVPFLLIVGVHFVFTIIRRFSKDPDFVKASFLRFVLGSAIVVATAGTTLLQIPLGISFVLSKPQFEPFISSAPVSQYACSGERTLLSRRLGMWHVDRYGTDPRGGTYFRIGTSMDGIGPDTMSHGFAFKPNPEGSPFGNAKYYYSRITGSWFYFAASDDW